MWKFLNIYRKFIKGQKSNAEREEFTTVVYVPVYL